MDFSKSELELLAAVLEMASDEFSNHGCNEYSIPNTDENWELIQQIENEMMDEDRERTRPPPDKEIYTFDWIAMRFFQRKAEALLKAKFST